MVIKKMSIANLNLRIISKMMITKPTDPKTTFINKGVLSSPAATFN